MSIDHGKVLALIKQARAEYRDSDAAGDALDWLEERALSRPAEAVQCIWPDCGHDTNQSDPLPGCNGKFCPKPAEAAEDITDLVMQPGAACPTCKQFLHVQPAEAVEGLTVENAPFETRAPAFGGGYWHKVEHGWKWCTGSTFPRPGGDWTGELIPPAHDAAQGAVAEQDAAFADWLVSQIPPGTVISSPQWWAPKIARAYRNTHPQAAPAQGDDAFLRRGLWECFKLAGGDTDGASGPEAIDNADLTIIAVRTVRDLRECYDERAAAPSPEPRS